MIKKKVSPTGRSVRVTFELPGDVAEEGVALAGSFNDWDPEADPMKYIKTRSVWKKGITFKPGERHEFRYLVDGEEWRNDEDADDYVSNEYFEENSVVEV